jgi:hypothetical protein
MGQGDGQRGRPSWSYIMGILAGGGDTFMAIRFWGLAGDVYTGRGRALVGDASHSTTFLPGRGAKAVKKGNPSPAAKCVQTSR